MLILAVDTSGLTGSIALTQDSDCLAEQRLDLGQHHGQSLVPAVHQLLRGQGVSPRDIQLTAVSIGPGSFTGLRVGVVLAKTLAWATGCQLAGVGTFDALAAAVTHDQVPAGVEALHVVSDAQRGEVFRQEFRLQDNRWKSAGGIVIEPASEWAASVSPQTAVLGPGLVKFRELLDAQVPLLPEALWTCQATAVAAEGLRLARAGQLSDVWSLEPLYLRRSSAEDTWDRLGRK